MEDIEANFIVGGEKVENGAEGVECKTSAVDRRGCDRLGEVVANAWKEHVNAWRLENQVNQQIVCSRKLLLRGRVEGDRSRDNLLKCLIFLIVVDEGLDLFGDIEILADLESQISKVAVDKDVLG